MSTCSGIVVGNGCFCTDNLPENCSVLMRYFFLPTFCSALKFAIFSKSSRIFIHRFNDYVRIRSTKKKRNVFSLRSKCCVNSTDHLLWWKKTSNVKKLCRLQPVSFCCQKRFFYYIPIMHRLCCHFVQDFTWAREKRQYLIIKLSILSNCSVHKRSVFGEKVRAKRKSSCFVYVHLNRSNKTRLKWW